VDPTNGDGNGRGSSNASQLHILRLPSGGADICVGGYSHHNLKGPESADSGLLNYSAEARKVLEDKPEALKLLNKLNISYLY